MFLDQNTAESTGAPRPQTTDSLTIPDRADTEPVETTQTGSLMDRPDSPYTNHVDDLVLQIIGRWTLVPKGMDRRLFSGIPGSLWIVRNRLTISDTGPNRGTGGSIEIHFKNITRCKRDWDWSVGMLSLRGVIHGTTDGVSHTRLRPCDRNWCHHSDAIIGTDVLGSVLPHTLDIKNGLLFTEGGASLQLHWRDYALSGRVFTVGHCSIPPYSEAVLHCSVRTTGGRQMPASGLLEGLILFAENTGLIVGRTLVDPSRWKVPVLISNFSQDTVVVAPFSEVGMIAQVSAIQSIKEPLHRPQVDASSLPAHLRDLLDQTSRYLDITQQRRLADVLLHYSDLFPTPGSTLTGHTDAVEHEIDTGDSFTHTLCASSNVPLEDEKGRGMCYWDADRWADRAQWQSPVVLVTKKGWWYPVLCWLPPPQRCYCEGSLPAAKNWWYLGYAGR